MKIIIKPLLSVVVVLGLVNQVNAAIYLSNDFEGGTFANTIVSTHGGTITPRNVSSGNNVSITHNGIAHSGTHAVQCQWRAAALDSRSGNAELGFNIGTVLDDMYLRFYVYFPNGTESGEVEYIHRDNPGTSENNKMLRVWNNDYSYGKWGASLDWRNGTTSSRLKARANDNVTGCGDNSTVDGLGDMLQPAKGVWIAMEYHFKPDTGVGNGIYEFWVDGVLIGSRYNINTLGAPCSPTGFLQGYIMGYANSAFPSITNVYIDDVVVADTYIGPMGADSTAPVLTQTTPIQTPTNDSTPNYTFSSTEPGTITYGGDCSSNTTSAVSGNNTITLETLIDGTYSDCTITVTDSSNHTSNPLSIDEFTITTSAPSIRADVDGEAGITSIDASLTLRNSLGLDMSMTNWQPSATTGDVNCDGVSNSTDALLILRDFLGLDMSGTGWCVN